MGNHICKIIVIVLIVIGALIFVWIISTIVQVLCMGVACLQALCCCCCSSGNRGYATKVVQPEPSPYHNPNMYPENSAPMYRPQQAYTPMTQTEYQPVNTYNQYKPPHSTGGAEDPFNDQKHRY